MAEIDHLLNQPGDIPDDQMEATEALRRHISSLRGKRHYKKLRKEAVIDALITPKITKVERDDIRENYVGHANNNKIGPKLLAEARQAVVTNPEVDPTRADDTHDKIVALAAVGVPYVEIARRMNVHISLVQRYVQNSTTFDELREREARYYVIRAWRSLHRISDALEKKIETTDLSTARLRDLTGAMTDLKRSIENAVSIVQVNIQNQQEVPTDDMIMEYVKTNHGLMQRIIEYAEQMAADE